MDSKRAAERSVVKKCPMPTSALWLCPACNCKKSHPNGWDVLHSAFLSILEYQQTPPRISTPPMIWNAVGISLKRKAAMAAAATGSQSLDAETKEGEKYFRHQLKMLWPRMVEKMARRAPTTMALGP